MFKILVGVKFSFVFCNKAVIKECLSVPELVINTSYLTDSYIAFTLKMESVSKNTIFGLKMMVKSGLEKFFPIFQYF